MPATAHRIAMTFRTIRIVAASTGIAVFPFVITSRVGVTAKTAVSIIGTTPFTVAVTFGIYKCAVLAAPSAGGRASSTFKRRVRATAGLCTFTFVSAAKIYFAHVVVRLRIFAVFGASLQNIRYVIVPAETAFFQLYPFQFFFAKPDTGGIIFFGFAMDITGKVGAVLLVHNKVYIRCFLVAADNKLTGFFPIDRYFYLRSFCGNRNL